MCKQIVIEKEFVVKAVREFKKLYPQASAHKAALKWGSKFARDGYVHDNENGSFTIKIDAGKGKQEFLVVNKVCVCGIGNPCAHRVAVNLAVMASNIRAATSEFLLDRADVQSELAEAHQPYLMHVAPMPHKATDVSGKYIVHADSKPVCKDNRQYMCPKCGESNCREHGLLVRPFFTESDEVRAVLREQEERSND